jgi:hypothetical protein
LLVPEQLLESAKVVADFATLLILFESGEGCQGMSHVLLKVGGIDVVLLVGLWVEKNTGEELEGLEAEVQQRV